MHSNRKDCRYYFQSPFIYIYLRRIINILSFCHTNGRIKLITFMLCFSVIRPSEEMIKTKHRTSDITIFNTFDIVKNYNMCPQEEQKQNKTSRKTNKTV